MSNAAEITNKAKEVLQIEMDGILSVCNQIGDRFVTLAETCMKTLDKGGKIVVAGIGKSGHIGRKISATLASTGSPSIFMHPVEAMHGDLGMLQENDLLLALSYSGETAELNAIILPAKRLGVTVACFTGTLGFSSVDRLVLRLPCSSMMKSGSMFPKLHRNTLVVSLRTLSRRQTTN